MMDDASGRQISGKDAPYHNSLQHNIYQDIMLVCTSVLMLSGFNGL